MAQIRPLAPELAHVARSELNEVDERVQEDIEALRVWINEQPHLKARTDDQFLVAFLRFCKYKLEAAKQRIDYFYTYKSVIATDLVKSRHIDEKLLAIAQSSIFARLPAPVGPGGPRIHVTLMGNIDTSKFTVADLFRFQVFRAEIEINTDDNWVVSGVVEIIDCSRIPFAFLRQFEPSTFKKMAAFLEYGMPTNLQATHIINASKEVQIILGLVRQLMKQKELLHIHSNIESLQKAIGKEYLPAEFGGENSNFPEARANYEALMKSYEGYFAEDEKNYGVDERLRACKAKTSAPVPAKSPTGSEGSFRKLNFD